MSMLTDKDTVEDYLQFGCGRCSKFKLPSCKVHKWGEELQALRSILVNLELTETIKWGHPCYTHNGKNVVLINAFNDNCMLSFMNGSILNDPQGILELPGENSTVGRVIRFTNVEQIALQQTAILALLKEAISNAAAGKRATANNELTYTPEMIEAFEKDPDLSAAFEKLTLGRKRGYVMHFSQPKKTETCKARILKSTAQILAGKGFNER